MEFFLLMFQFVQDLGIYILLLYYKSFLLFYVFLFLFCLDFYCLLEHSSSI